MAAKKETAEQKLLKMMEASSGNPDSEKTQKKVAKKENFLTIIKTCNKIFIVGVILAALFLANEVKAGLDLMSKQINFSINPSMSNQNSDLKNIIPSIQRLSFYLANINRRNLFQPYEEEVGKEVVEAETDRMIVRKTKKFKLVGISWLDTIDSASAMIEDKEKATTYFLQKGEKLEDIIVKTIYADSVELGYKDEEIIIRYDKSQM